MSKSVFLLLLGDGREDGGLGGVEGAGAAPVHLPVHLQRLGDGGHGDLLGHLVNHLLSVALDHIIIIISTTLATDSSHLDGAVVLGDLYGLLATGGEVLWLGQVAGEAVVLHGRLVILGAHRLLAAHARVVVGPELGKVGHNVVTSIMWGNSLQS